MDLREINYFIAVSEAGSFTQASRRLGVAQSALSRQISVLEADLGIRLLHRHGRGVRLTPEGVGFLASVSPVVRDLHVAREEMRAGATLANGAVSVGMGITFATTIAGDVIRNFRKNNPQVRLRIDLLVGILDPLDAGSIDMAISSGDQRVPSLHSFPLFDAGLFLMGRARDLDGLTDNPDTVDASALAGLPLILLGHRRGLRHEIERIATACGFTIEPVLELTMLDAIVEVVQEGHGFTVLPFGPVSSASLASEPLAVRRIVNPSASLLFDVTYSRHKPRTLAMREMERVIREETRRAVLEGRMDGTVIEPDR